jgi:hypothetical protein
MKNLYSKIGLSIKVESEHLEFVEYVGAAKEGFLKKAQ